MFQTQTCHHLSVITDKLYHFSQQHCTTTEYRYTFVHFFFSIFPPTMDFAERKIWNMQSCFNSTLTRNILKVPLRGWRTNRDIVIIIVVVLLETRLLSSSIRTVTAFFFSSWKLRVKNWEGKKVGKKIYQLWLRKLPGWLLQMLFRERRVNIWVEEKVKCNITGSMMEIKWKLVLQQVVRSGW